jgi:hypothetical protein
MFHIRLIIYWYLFLTSLVLVSSISLTNLDFLPGLILVWMLLIIFIIGSKIKVNTRHADVATRFVNAKNANLIHLIIAIAFLVFFPFYIKYYTGSSIFLVFINLFSGNSNYLAYQEYFAGQSLNVFSLAKLPYIVGAGILKFLFISCFCRLMGFKGKRNFIEVLAIFTMVLVTIILAISRGTSFEFFEFIILFVFSILLRRRRMDLFNWFKGTTLILISIIGGLIVLVFSLNIDARGEFNCITKEMCYDDQGMLASFSPQLGHISFKLSGYFIFGIFIISKTLTSIVGESLPGLIALFIPFGTKLLGLGPSYPTIICENFLDCSVAWIPDLLLILNNFGLLITVSLLFILGVFSKKIFYQAINGSIPAAIILYFVFLFMVSLPVGNFITVSSSNLIAIFCAAILYAFNIKGWFFGFFDTQNSSEIIN